LKIAYITERDLNSKQILGAVTRDIRLLDVLNNFAEVDIYFNDPSKYHKYLYMINNQNINKQLFDEIDRKFYDIVIISTFFISPFLQGYNSLKAKKIFYFADSAFHMRNQYINLKFKIAANVGIWKEKNILKENYCAYLGIDEIKYIPKEYKQNCLIFPFFINLNKNLFNNDGKLILVGDYSFKPNYIMLQNINNIAELIKNDIYIYGNNIPKLNFKSNIKIVGYADTLDEIYQDARALIYAIDYGTGIKNKVLEAMSYGIPTIGYKEAFTNLDLIDKNNCVVVNSLKYMIEMCNNANLSKISDSLYEYTKKNFSLQAITSKIQYQLKAIINDKKNI
jgi:glycosyltransferase involved in cell wall biosynthesis